MKKLLLVILLGVLVTGVCFAMSRKPSLKPPPIQTDSSDSLKLETSEKPFIFTDSGDFPHPINPTAPKYPPDDIKARIQGIVELWVDVYKDGTVGKITVHKSLQAGPGGLDEAAINAVKQWKFEPGKSGGKPVDSMTIIPIEFTITKDDIPLMPNSIVLPQYPDELVQAGIKGLIVFDASIKKDGSISNIKVKENQLDIKSGLEKETIKAFKQWKFYPGRKEGKPVISTVSVEIEYYIPRYYMYQTIGWHRIKVADANIVVPVMRTANTNFDNPPFVVNPKLPDYPAFANKSGLEGIVILEVDVDKYGNTDKIKVVKSLMPGPHGLDEAAIDAVKQWKFEPAMKDGKTVDATILIPIEFKYENK
jgi:TonB family protein